ncbi:MAG: hypothetical protein PHE55_21080 [Methylococcaceae bacterium]|nr:hypothetical protein [Methylococcaceae bacterium]
MKSGVTAEQVLALIGDSDKEEIQSGDPGMIESWKGFVSLAVAKGVDEACLRRDRGELAMIDALIRGNLIRNPVVKKWVERQSLLQLPAVTRSRGTP